MVVGRQRTGGDPAMAAAKTETADLPVTRAGLLDRNDAIGCGNEARQGLIVGREAPRQEPLRVIEDPIPVFGVVGSVLELVGVLVEVVEGRR